MLFLTVECWCAVFWAVNLFSWRKQGEFGVKRKKNFQAIRSCHVLLTRILTPPGKREQKRTIRGDNNGPSPPPCADKIVNVIPRWIPRQNFVSRAPTVKRDSEEIANRNCEHGFTSRVNTGNIMVRQLRVNSAKRLNCSVWKKQSGQMFQ